MNQRVSWPPSQRSEVQASGWCWVRIYVCTYCLFAGMWRPLVSVITALLRCDDYFSLSSVVSRTFSMLRVYAKFAHHPHPLGYFCVKFCFLCSHYCCARRWRIFAYSFNQNQCCMSQRNQSAQRQTLSGFSQLQSPSRGPSTSSILTK